MPEENRQRKRPQLSPLEIPNGRRTSRRSRSSVPSASRPLILPNDIVVLVMGVVGAGKSTFINSLLPSHSKRMAVGKTLSACTAKAHCAILEPDDLAPIMGSKPKYRLILVDTPGFDAGDKLDSEGVLQEIVNWSKTWLPDGQKCRGGVIFMHDLSADRFQGRNDLVTLSETFKAPTAAAQLVIVTSKWRRISTPGEGERRHKIIQQNFVHAKLQKFRQEQFDGQRILREFLPLVERGAMLDFERKFGVMKSNKVAKENSDKKERSKLSRFFGFFAFWRRK